MMPDEEKLAESKSPLAAKLAILLGLLPNSSSDGMTDIADTLLFAKSDGGAS